MEGLLTKIALLLPRRTQLNLRNTYKINTVIERQWRLKLVRGQAVRKDKREFVIAFAASLSAAGKIWATLQVATMPNASFSWVSEGARLQ